MASNALTKWSRIQSMVWIPLLIAAVGVNDPIWMRWRLFVALLILASVATLGAALRIRGRIQDLITVGRVVILATAIGLLEIGSWIVWFLALTLSLLDLVDGWVARQLGPTPEGAVLDMESDQLVVTGFSLLVVASGGGLHVLLLPLMRPAFVLAAWVYGLPSSDPKPIDGDNRRGKLVCALVMVSLLFAMLPDVSWMRELTWLRDVATGVAVLALIWSFGSDWTFLANRRRRQSEGA